MAYENPQQGPINPYESLPVQELGPGYEARISEPIEADEALQQHTGILGYEVLAEIDFPSHDPHNRDVGRFGLVVLRAVHREEPVLSPALSAVNSPVVQLDLHARPVRSGTVFAVSLEDFAMLAVINNTSVYPRSDEEAAIEFKQRKTIGTRVVALAVGKPVMIGRGSDSAFSDQIIAANNLEAAERTEEEERVKASFREYMPDRPKFSSMTVSRGHLVLLRQNDNSVIVTSLGTNGTNLRSAG